MIGKISRKQRYYGALTHLLTDCSLFNDNF
jgi:hypothetical protein